MARNERKGHEGIEVTARLAVDRRQVRSTDAGERGRDPYPFVRGEVGFVDVGESEWADAGARSGQDTRGNRRGRISGLLALKK
jgi:hypothetical protein